MSLPVKALRALREQIDELLADCTDAPEPLSWPLTINAPSLKKGERHIGILISADGTRREHLILLPGSKADLTWQDAMDWAKKQGGELPDRVEGALLFATKQEGEFEPEWYWTREQHAANSNTAWCQIFGGGYQHWNGKDDKLRARAVRRSPIE